MFVLFHFRGRALSARHPTPQQGRSGTASHHWPHRFRLRLNDFVAPAGIRPKTNPHAGLVPCGAPAIRAIWAFGFILHDWLAVALPDFRKRNTPRTSLCGRVSKTHLAWGGTRAACQFSNDGPGVSKDSTAALQAAGPGALPGWSTIFPFQIQRGEVEAVETGALGASESRCDSCYRDQFPKPSIRSQAGKSRPGAHNPGDPEHYRGLPPISLEERRRSGQRTVNPPSQNRPEADEWSITTGAYQFPISFARGVTVAHRIVNPRSLGANPSGRAIFSIWRCARLARLSVLKTVMAPQGPWEFDPLRLRHLSPSVAQSAERSTDNREVAGATPAGRTIFLNSVGWVAERD